jgi:hypothetical protein
MAKTPPPPPPPVPDRRQAPGDEVLLESEAANDAPIRGTWVHVTVTLSDGATLELTIPSATGGAISGYEPAPGEGPALWVTRGGQRRRAKLGVLLEGP